jgi:SPP1 family predicted phage head-tail adaptor
MNAGRFRHKIDVQQELTTQNTYGEPTQTWVTFLSGMYCSIEPIRGKEYLSSDIIQAEVSHRIKMRFVPGVHPKQRILYCGRYFYIIDAIDIVEQHKMLECMCKELI